LLDKKEILRAAQKILSLFVTMGIKPFLDVGKQVRCKMNLIQDDGWRIESKEPAWVDGGSLPDVRRLERHIVIAFPKKMLQQGRFAGLAWSSEDHCGKFSGRPR
jgi:hypothetical protein